MPDVEVLDSKIANLLEKLLTVDFKRRLHMNEQKSQQDFSFLKGRQIAQMICDHFKISRTSEALLDTNILLRVQLKNDNEQRFDTKWDKAPSP